MPDYLASIVVFGVLLTIFLSSWNSVLNNQTEFKREDQMRFRGTHTTTFLVSTPGYPRDWEETGKDLRIPGFANPDHLLQSDKLEAFRDLDYKQQKEVLQAREFYMSVRNETDVLELNGQELVYGKNYSNADTVIPFTRSVQVNLSGKIVNAKLEYVVWS